MSDVYMHNIYNSYNIECCTIHDNMGESFSLFILTRVIETVQMVKFAEYLFSVFLSFGKPIPF